MTAGNVGAVGIENRYSGIAYSMVEPQPQPSHLAMRFPISQILPDAQVLMQKPAHPILFHVGMGNGSACKEHTQISKYQNIHQSSSQQLSYETCTMDRYVLVPSKLMIPSPWDQDGKAPGYRERNGKGLDSSAVEFLICDWWNVAQSRAVLKILFVQYMFRCYYSSVLFHLRMIRKLPILLQG